MGILLYIVYVFQETFFYLYSLITRFYFHKYLTCVDNGPKFLKKIIEQILTKINIYLTGKDMIENKSETRLKSKVTNNDNIVVLSGGNFHVLSVVVQLRFRLSPNPIHIFWISLLFSIKYRYIDIYFHISANIKSKLVFSNLSVISQTVTWTPSRQISFKTNKICELKTQPYSYTFYINDGVNIGLSIYLVWN